MFDPLQVKLSEGKTHYMRIATNQFHHQNVEVKKRNLGNNSFFKKADLAKIERFRQLDGMLGGRHAEDGGDRAIWWMSDRVISISSTSV